jgi:hypothetical protein
MILVSSLAVIACSPAFAGTEAGNHPQDPARVGGKIFDFLQKEAVRSRQIIEIRFSCMETNRRTA